MRRYAIVLVALAALAGCGSGSRTSGTLPAPHNEQSPAERQIRTTVESWLLALVEDDSAGACSYLTPSLQRSITTQLRIHGETGTCKTAAATWTGGSTPPGHRGAHVTDVRVAQGAASATLKAPPDRESQVDLRKVRGHWLIQNY
jgi:hypothetical protein